MLIIKKKKANYFNMNSQLIFNKFQQMKIILLEKKIVLQKTLNTVTVNFQLAMIKMVAIHIILSNNKLRKKMMKVSKLHLALHHRKVSINYLV